MIYGPQYSPTMPTPYNGFNDPYSARLASLQQPAMPMPMPQSYDIIQVHGEPGARAFRMAPNSRCLLLDDTDPIVWLAQTDGAGYQTLTPYTITPYQPQAPIDNNLDARLTKLEAIIYGKPDAAAAQQTNQQLPSATAAAE